MLIKLGEAVTITQEDIQSSDVILAEPEILERFKKFAADLKVIAPAAKDFLYFTAVMMHAAEAALLDDKGEIRKDAKGNPLKAMWEVGKNGSWKWVCSDNNLRPTKNANGDIFPEAELLKAYKKWVGRPLCLDHKSSSVDMIRGIIVDTHYDTKNKRVIALCALDKVNYGDLARKVETGYAASVSMGTAVGKAICYDCGRVAKIESDFCDHMRSKSCYGEINCDLNPIELSIVVNGADPKAKIKHIIARDLSKAADHIDEYMKQKLSQGNTSKEELVKVQEDLQSLTEKMSRLVAAQKEDKNDTNYGTTGSAKSMPDSEEDPNHQPIAMPGSLTGLSELHALQVKVATIQQNLDNLTMRTNKETNMTTTKEAYYQGTVEPTPGRPQYEKEDYETIRDSQDKQMVGQSPFPGTGPVDGMHPGVQSAGESEEARKRRLQRMAELEEKRLNRQAALQKAKENIEKGKEAYFQGGGGPNEPSPGKAKYEKDPLNEKARKEDKHMVGQKPFPDVGSVDGLHPSPASADEKDELKRKEMLARAALKAKFIKAAASDGKSLDVGNSCWQVYAGDKLILTATVDEITNGKSEALYDTVATREFGLRMLEKIKSEGFDKAKALFKKAQPAAMEAAPGLPADAMPAPAEAPLKEPSGGGSEEDSYKALAQKIRDTADQTAKYADDLLDMADKANSELPELADVPAAGEADFDMSKAASTDKLQGMRKYLNGMLQSALTDTAAVLRGHNKELSLAASTYDSDNLNKLTPEQKKYLDSLALDAVNDAKNTLAESVKLMRAWIKYAHGSDEVQKRTMLEKQAQMQEPDTMDKKPGEEHGGLMADDVGTDEAALQRFLGESVTPVTELPEERIVGKAPSAPKPQLPKGVDTGAGKAKPMPVPPKPAPGDPLGQDPRMPHAPGFADDGNDAMMVELPEGAKMDSLPEGSKVKSAEDLTTKEGRAEFRMKLAQKGLEWNEMLDKAHPQGGHTPGGLDTKPSDDLAKVETLEEAHDAHMELAQMQPKARKQAEKIRQLVAEGALTAEEVDGLVSKGVDPAAVSYYKKYWAEAGDSESKQWAADLVKEHAKQKMAEEVQKEHVRIKRAYELAYEMKDRNVIDASQISQQVDTILKWNDEAFESTKRMITRMPMKKNSMPQVGLMHSDDLLLPTATASDENVELKDVFEDFFSGKRH